MLKRSAFRFTRIRGLPPPARPSKNQGALAPRSPKQESGGSRPPLAETRIRGLPPPARPNQNTRIRGLPPPARPSKNQGASAPRSPKPEYQNQGASAPRSPLRQIKRGKFCLPTYAIAANTAASSGNFRRDPDSVHHVPLTGRQKCLFNKRLT